VRISAQSDIRFDREPGQPFPAGIRRQSHPLRMPPAITSSLAANHSATRKTSVSDKDTVGTLIEAKSPMTCCVRGGSIPDGSIVRGRIRRLERYLGGGAFIVGLEFTESGIARRITAVLADLLRIDKSPRIQPALFERVIGA